MDLALLQACHVSHFSAMPFTAQPLHYLVLCDTVYLGIDNGRVLDKVKVVPN